jgi:beta-phosphoglucomutase
MPIRLLIFDIDGVLLKSKKLHEISLIMALRHYGYDISTEYHKEHLDGLPTKMKLEKLNIPKNIRNEIFDLKQKYTMEQADQHLARNKDVRSIFQKIHADGYKIAVASNAIKDFCALTIDILEIGEYVNTIMSNEDVSEPKPSPEIYVKIMNSFQCAASETLIFEDSKVGLAAAFSSGANVFIVEDTKDITIESIQRKIRSLN